MADLVEVAGKTNSTVMLTASDGMRWTMYLLSLPHPTWQSLVEVVETFANICEPVTISKKEVVQRI